MARRPGIRDPARRSARPRGHRGESWLLFWTLIVLLVLPAVPGGLGAPALPPVARASPIADDGAAQLAAAEASLKDASPLGGNAPPGWRAVNDATHPSARFGAAAAYDPTSGTVVLFGGTDGTSFFNDTWVFTTTAAGFGSWHAIATSAAPSPRAGSAFAFDEAIGSLVLFGGNGPAGLLGDTWTFGAAGWDEIATTGPSAREGAGLTYDEGNARLLLFGGFDGHAYPNDLWTLGPGGWSAVPTNDTPAGRAFATFVFDPGLARVILAGGEAGAGPLNGSESLEGRDWIAGPSNGTAPSTSSAISAFDLADGVLLVAGGNGSIGPQNSTTELAGTANWSEPHLIGGLPGRTGAAGAFDQALGAVVAFGGWNGTALNSTYDFSMSTNRLVWSTVDRTATAGQNGSNDSGAVPARRTQAAMVYDPSDGYVLLFGGTSRAVNDSVSGDLPVAFGIVHGSFFNDTWIFRNGRWTELFPALAPSPRRGAMVTYDARDGYVVLFGGSNETRYFNDTWTYRAGVWTNITRPGAPPARRSGGLAFDEAEDAVILYGGHNNTVQGTSPEQNPPMLHIFGDTWSFVAGVWTRLYPKGSAPSPSAEPFLAYDPGSGYLVLFGGYRANNSRGEGEDTLNYTYTFANDTWTNLSAQDALHPPWRDGGAFVYDYALGGLVEWGGDYEIPILTDVWIFRDGYWNESCSNCAPDGQAAEHGVYDPSYGALFTFGPPNYNMTAAAVTSFGFADPRPALTITPSAVDLGYPNAVSAVITGGIQPLSDPTWTFGDGSSPTSGWSAVHQYAVPGTFTVTFRAVDGIGNVTNASATIAVGGPLSVTLSALPFDTRTQPVTSHGRLNATVVGGTGPYTFNFSFGDGSSEVTHASAVVHGYSVANATTFRTGVSVVDAYNQTASAAGPPLTLPAMAPIHDLSVARSRAAVPANVTMAVNGTDPYSPLSYLWTASGNTTIAAAGRNATLELRTVGPVAITVTVSDAANFSETLFTNATGLPGLFPNLTFTIGQGTCPSNPSSVPLSLSGTAAGGLAPYSFRWDVDGTILDGPAVATKVDPSLVVPVSLGVTDAAGDFVEMNRTILSPIATCGVVLGFLTPTLLEATGVALLLAAVIALEVIHLRRQRRTPLAPPSPYRAPPDTGPGAEPSAEATEPPKE